MPSRYGDPGKRGKLNQMTTALAEKNAHQLALENFDLAADALELEGDIREMIKYPERILTVTLPVRMDNGRRPPGCVGCSRKKKVSR